MEPKVQRLIEVTGDSRHWTAEDALEDALRIVQENPSLSSAAILLMGRQPGGEVSYDLRIARMDGLDLIGALECIRTRAVLEHLR